MTTPLWGHKPPPVANTGDYCADAPPEPSARAVYWMWRFREGSWFPNRRLRGECGDCQAAMLGVWVWEARRAFIPLEQLLFGTPLDVIVGQTVEWSRDAPGPYWGLLEERSRPADVPEDGVSNLAAAMQAARRRPVSALDALRGRR